MSLLEKMGYGAKSKTESKWDKVKAAVEDSAAITAKKRRSSTFHGVAVGDGDLKARLAAQKEALQKEMKAFEKMNLSIPEFIKLFRTNDNLVNKLAITTSIPAIELKCFEDDQIREWFIEMDTDKSGTLDFKEFIEGILKLKSGERPGSNKLQVASKAKAKTKSR